MYTGALWGSHVMLLTAFLYITLAVLVFTSALHVFKFDGQA